MMESEIDWTRVEHFVLFCWRLAFRHRGSISGGCRTEKRNRDPSVGGTSGSKHTFKGGWGMACDFVFDDPQGRDAARSEADAAGWHTYVGDDYGPLRLHLQGWAVGALPTMEG